MKITDQLIPGTFKISSNQNNHDVFFDTLLNAPVKNNNGDDYYRQHQDQLQQSDLNFSPMTMSPEKKPMAEPLENLKASTNNQTDPACLIEQNTKALAEPDCALIKTSSSPMMSPDQLNTTIKALHAAAIIQQENKLEDELPKNSRPNPANINPVLQNPMVFKNHQLFINNNLAELSLNTTQLSKDEARELQKLVKQWLSNKGHVLKQFILNGEKQ